MNILTPCLIAAAALISPSICLAGTAKFYCPDNPDDGDHCVVTILIKDGGGRNFPLPDGQEIRETANSDDTYCVIPILDESEVQCTQDTSMPLDDYEDD